ncbi:hypothetical protein ATCR1_00175 [Agrobacterium tumefaciens CCNWGS0286]|nr:hypothetical protein ATCR1_00175 [Agrobacterium tumefaciens CCNWGS0286]
MFLAHAAMADGSAAELARMETHGAALTAAGKSRFAHYLFSGGQFSVSWSGC